MSHSVWMWELKRACVTSRGNDQKVTPYGVCELKIYLHWMSTCHRWSHPFLGVCESKWCFSPGRFIEVVILSFEDGYWNLCFLFLVLPSYCHALRIVDIKIMERIKFLIKILLHLVHGVCIEISSSLSSKSKWVTPYIGRVNWNLCYFFFVLPNDCHVLCIVDVKIMGAYKVPYKDFMCLMRSVCVETDEPRIMVLSVKVAPFGRVSWN